jgi:guanylate kinase
MNKKFRLSTALDIDDVLMECVPYAIRLANEKYHFDPPLTIYEVDRWGKLGTRADVIFEFMNDPDFFKNQPVIKGAREFVKKLAQMTEVFVTTAVWPQYMTIRFQRILEEFPEIPSDHILIGSRKDKIDVDILFDDGMHNVFSSNAAYPILMRRPWNREATGTLAVNNYEEFLKLVEVIADSYSVRPERYSMSQPSILVLVGPSGSGKNAVAEKILEKTDRFQKLISYTTDEAAAGRRGGWYHHVPLEQFRDMQECGEIFESTTYAHQCYGSRKADVEQILAQGGHVLTVMDICGAMSLKTHFSNVVTVYVKRDKKDLLADVLEKQMPTAEKVNRLLAIDGETRNAQICDYVVQFTDEDQASEEILRSLNIL